MRKDDQAGRITRRDFFERGARAVAGAGLLAAGNSANAATMPEPEAANANSGPMPDKIALEEHFVIPET